MEDVLLLSFVAKLAQLFVAVLTLWCVARLWNHLSGNQFGRAHETMHRSPVALGLYYGLRFVAFAVLVSRFL